MQSTAIFFVFLLIATVFGQGPTNELCSTFSNCVNCEQEGCNWCVEQVEPRLANTTGSFCTNITSAQAASCNGANSDAEDQFFTTPQQCGKPINFIPSQKKKLILFLNKLGGVRMQWFATNVRRCPTETVDGAFEQKDASVYLFWVSWDYSYYFSSKAFSRDENGTVTSGCGAEDPLIGTCSLPCPDRTTCFSCISQGGCSYEPSTLTCVFPTNATGAAFTEIDQCPTPNAPSSASMIKVAFGAVFVALFSLTF